jgi:signal transduction histidine kinase/CheY-like chemotaxis protein
LTQGDGGVTIAPNWTQNQRQSRVDPSRETSAAPRGGAMTEVLAGDKPVFLSTLPADRGQTQLAWAVVLLSALVFLALAPFATVQLAQAWVFIPVYQSALVVNDAITAVLLLGQFAILRSRALLVLAGGYLFTACMAALHALTFPGLFAPAGLFGAGPQSTAWIYMLWHAGLPLAVIAYARLSDPQRVGEPRLGRGAIVACVGVALSAAAACTALATAGQSLLPEIMRGSHYAPAMSVVVSSVWLFSLAALVALWRRRPRTVLDLWLMVVMCAWMCDVALSAVLNAGRFDLGFYAGRVYGLLAATFVLMVLLLENGRLYARLVETHDREHRKSTALLHLNAKLESMNTMLADLNRQLQQAGRFKSEFLANMSHEVRTPLNAIIGFAELLKNGLVDAQPDKRRRFETQIFDSGQHLLTLINDVLDLSKVETGKMQLELETVELDDFLRGCLAMFDEASERRRIRLDYAGPAQSASVLIDARKLRQIVYNLLSNAIKFTPDGGTIRLTANAVPPDGLVLGAPADMATRVLPLPAGSTAERFLEIRVSDSGGGMVADDLPQLFEAFHQVQSARHQRHVGTGLGLALVARFASLHGGTVGVASAPGRGTQFAVWIPWREAAAAPRPSFMPAAMATGPQSGAGAHAVRHALVIEDNEHAAELLRMHLESAGFEVSCAIDGSEIGHAAGPIPDIITLDILLPGTSGWDVLEQLKKDPALGAVPVVIVSVVAERQKGFALGASQVLQKPVTRDELLQAVASVGLGSRLDRAQRVLVIDDDPLAVEMVASNLEGPNCEVLRAHDGGTAIDIALSARPDLIILDLMMPGISGFEVVDRVRSLPDMAAVPILVMTAKTVTTQDRERLNGHVLKIMDKGTLDRDRFMSEVSRALRAP